MRKFVGYEHGVNLGGWLSQCDHTVDNYNNFIREEDFETISSWGLDHVRIPVDYEVVEEHKEYIDMALEWCKRYGLNMILDLHKTRGFSFDSGESEVGFFESEKYQDIFYRLWEGLAERYKDESDVMAFELLNEVTDAKYCDIWNEISLSCIKYIRNIAPDMRIVVGGYHNNSMDAVRDLAMPYDENIVYTFHCYEPLIFTHQGAHWVKGMDNDFRIPIDTSYGEMERMSAKYIDQVTVGFRGFDRDESLAAKYFDEFFAEVVGIGEERNVPIYCGEYGVIDLAMPEDTLKWYRMIGSTFDKYGIGRAAWNYRGKDFGLVDEHLKGILADITSCL